VKPYLEDNTRNLTAEEAAEVIEHINHRRKFGVAQPAPRRMAWEQGFGHRVTAEDVRQAWQAIKRARIEQFADAEPLIAEFQKLLESWLNS
jgi:hypothetical protein